MYKAPNIISGAGVAANVKNLSGPVFVATMDIPWALFQKSVDWTPDHLHMVADMDIATLEHLEAALPPVDTIVGIGGGSCCDTAKYLAWKRGCRMVLIPTIISVDAPLTNMVAVRVDNKVNYVGDIFPEELLVDYALIQQAPPELNRAGAADIASIHTGLYDWALARDNRHEAWDRQAAEEAQICLNELDRYADDVRLVTPRGIDTIVDLYRREVEFCARIGTSRPEEGSEHLIAYNVERITKRHFVHGDLVALGIHLMTRLQDNNHEWAVELMDRVGLRYRVPGLTRDELHTTLATLKEYVDREKMFYSIVNEKPVTPEFIDWALQTLF